MKGWESQDLEQKLKKMRPIIIKLIEFFLVPGIIPSQKYRMHKKIFLMLTKSIFENIKRGKKWSSSTGRQIPWEPGNQVPTKYISSCEFFGRIPMLLQIDIIAQPKDVTIIDYL